MHFCSDRRAAHSWTLESSLDQRTITIQTFRRNFSERFEGRPDSRTVARSCLTTVHRRALDMGVKGQPYEVFDGRSVLATTQRLEDDSPDFVQEIVLLYDNDTSCNRLVN